MVRFVKLLVTKTLAGSNAADWPELVPWVAAAVNTTVSRSSGYSPHELFFGEAAPTMIGPSLQMLPAVGWDLGNEGRDELGTAIQAMRKRMDDIRSRARSA